MNPPNEKKQGVVKDSAVAQVRIGFDGRVHKWYRGPLAEKRFANECRVLKYLEERECPFVPRVLEADPEQLYLITTNCGTRQEQMRPGKAAELFSSLESYGVRHNDQAIRNITYDQRRGRFCLIDFEFATILESGEGLRVEEAEDEHQRLKKLERERRNS